MGDMEQHEAALCLEDERLERLEDETTPAVMQVMTKDGEIYSVDCDTVTVVGVQIFVHAGAWRHGERRYFVEAIGMFHEYRDPEDPEYQDAVCRTCYLKCIHRTMGHHGQSIGAARHFAAELIGPNGVGGSDYLNRHMWRFNK